MIGKVIAFWDANFKGTSKPARKPSGLRGLTAKIGDTWPCTPRCECYIADYDYGYTPRPK